MLVSRYIRPVIGAPFVTHTRGVLEVGLREGSKIRT